MKYRFLLICLLAIQGLYAGNAGAQSKKSKGTKSAAKTDSSSNEIETLGKGLNFMVIGDWGRCGEDHQQLVADQMAKTSESCDASFIISTGDNFYEKGVMSVNDPLWQKSYENVYHHFSLQKDWYVVLGNHDYKTNPDAEVDYSKVSRRWHMPSRYYAVKIPMGGKDTAKKALFIFLDTSPLVGEYYNDFEYSKKVPTLDTAAEKAWLVKTLSDKDTNIKWRFVVGHHPLYTSGKRIKSPEIKQLRGSLKPIFDKYNVDAYITGHEHDLEYDKPAGKTHYFTSGTGSEARPIQGKLPETQFAVSDYGFMVFSIKDNKMLMQVVNFEGKILYKTLIDRK